MSDKTHRLGSGSFVFIPKGPPHAQGNLDPQPVRILGMIAPLAAFEGFMYDRAELAKTVKRHNPEFGKRMAEIARKYDLEVLGPAPVKP